MKMKCWPLLAFVLIAPAYAATHTANFGAADPQVSAKEKVAEFLVWERQIKPNGIHQADLADVLLTIVSDELLCLLNAASAAREIATREAPDEKPPFVEGNPFLPYAWDYHLMGSEILSSSAVSGSRDRSVVKVRFTFSKPGADASDIYHDTSAYLVTAEPQGTRITDIDAGGSCDFCQSGSLRTAIYETLTAYPAAGGEQCKGLAK